ncbi:MAG: hypothetical protein AAGA48_03425 [Myxococcota bacterium]
MLRIWGCLVLGLIACRSQEPEPPPGTEVDLSDCLETPQVALDFGEVVVGVAEEGSVTVFNRCEASIQLDAPTVEPLGDAVTFRILSPRQPLTLGVGDSAVVELDIDALDYASAEARLRITQAEEELDVRLTATGVCGQPPFDDLDADGIPDGCDACLGGDDAQDADGDGVPDACDSCMTLGPDIDADRVPDACDVCVLVNGPDTDEDGIVDTCDRCPDSDDSVDSDFDGVPDGCDACIGPLSIEVFPPGNTNQFPIDGIPAISTMDVRDDGIEVDAWMYDTTSRTIWTDAVTQLLTVEFVEQCGAAHQACSDGLDNDGDGLTDWPREPGCATPDDTTEDDPFVPPGCADGVDNDGDGQADFPNDPNCIAASHDQEGCTVLGRDGFGYTLCEERPANLPCPNLTANDRLDLPTGGNVEVPLGFEVDVYGKRVSSVFVESRGALSFENNGPLAAGNVCLPGALPRRTLFAWWDELEPSRGDVWVRSTGLAPERQFAVQWRVPHADGSTIDVRAVVRESGDLEVCYVDGNAGGIFSNGGNATAGLQGQALGPFALEYSCNVAALDDGLLLRYLHP